MNISVVYSDPIWLTTRSGYIKTLSSELDSYTDTTQALGGYDTSEISIRGSRNFIESWLENGLGRHIECYSPSGRKRWEGFVDDISASIGALSITRGPYLGLVNKVKVRYSDFTTNVSSATASASNTTSQGIYGIRYKILSAGKCSSTNAIRIRDSYLLENAYPESNQTISRGGDLTLSIGCKGYRHLLDYPYNESATTPYTLREKLIDVLENSVINIFSTNYNLLGTNTLSVSPLEDADRYGWDIIKELVALGGFSTNDRMLFGIYNDRKAVYNQIPSTTEYQMRLSDVGINVMSAIGARVAPWDVVPGKWIEFVDFMAGSSYSTTFRRNPRYMFIESTTFTAPSEVSFTGGKTDQLPARLAKLGLGGI